MPIIQNIFITLLVSTHLSEQWLIVGTVASVSLAALQQDDGPFRDLGVVTQSLTQSLAVLSEHHHRHHQSVAATTERWPDVVEINHFK